jgi:iron complex outermembrane receptor protein
MQFQNKVLPLAVLSAITSTQLAIAQENDGASLEEILVTGTLIRGIQPTGSQTIGLSEEAIVDIGAVSTNELLATIPQVSNFFNQRPEQDPRGADRLQVNRPNLRNLPGINSATGATTLILVDGHRLAPVGTDQASLDPDVIPSIAMQRVEVVTDGGSSLYGADAVGGVINFVTLDEFDGFKVDLGYDTGDDYDSWQASFLAGTRWDSGSGYIALATTDRDVVLKEDRDWAAQGQWDEEGRVLTPAGTECLEPVGAITTWYWYGAGWTDNPRAPGAGVTPVGEPCDDEGKSALIPEQERDNVYAGLTQQFGSGMSLNVKAYYMDRSTAYASYPTGDTVSEPSPTQLGIVGEESGELYDTAAVGFSYGVHPAYRDRDMELDIETWGITPTLTIDIGDSGWQSRNTFYYGESENTVYQPLSNRSKMLDYVAAGVLDPSNVAQADAAVIQDILDWENADEVDQEMWYFRSVGDGPLFELPAGTVRAALGVQYTDEEVEKRTGEATRGGTGSLPKKTADRDITSVFGELAIPVLDSLNLSLSARYDDYSDFGDTSNPNIGFDWNPTEWLTVFGKWGESFNAPTTLDAVIVANGRYIPDVAVSVPDPNGERTNPSRDDVFLLEGGSGELEPQESESWGLGFELRPLTGLEIKLYYYDIEFEQLLAAPNPQDPQAVLLNPDKFIFEPTDAEFDAFVASVDNSDQFRDLAAEDVGVIVDRRISNTDSATLKGYDFSILYSHDTSFGYMNYGISGNYQSEFDLVQTGTVVDQLEYNPDLYVSADIGWTGQNLRANLNFRYTDEYDANPGIAVNQKSVDDFLTTNLFIGYDFAGTGMAEGLSLRFNVDNLLDEDPPEYRTQRNLSYSEFGWTLGRVYKFGLTYTF